MVHIICLISWEIQLSSDQTLDDGSCEKSLIILTPCLWSERMKEVSFAGSLVFGCIKEFFGQLRYTVYR